MALPATGKRFLQKIICIHVDFCCKPWYKYILRVVCDSIAFLPQKQFLAKGSEIL